MKQEFIIDPESINTARSDVETCIQIWRDLILQNFSSNVEYIVVKGSSVKAWSSVIDYVPELSDVDIQVKFINSGEFKDRNLANLSIEDALEISKKYEKDFFKKRTSPLHL
ncbi:MAG: hypothetical protein KAT16_04235, partial [Candidatus Heimdallarchaeota archaeon]|nr:hypothetical protein [Candidatus Heimdallarchaeota archaeon]